MAGGGFIQNSRASRPRTECGWGSWEVGGLGLGSALPPAPMLCLPGVLE